MDKKSFSEKTKLKHSFRRRGVVPGAIAPGTGKFNAAIRIAAEELQPREGSPEVFPNPDSGTEHPPPTQAPQPFRQPVR